MVDNHMMGNPKQPTLHGPFLLPEILFAFPGFFEGDRSEVFRDLNIAHFVAHEMENLRQVLVEDSSPRTFF